MPNADGSSWGLRAEGGYHEFHRQRGFAPDRLVGIFADNGEDLVTCWIFRPSHVLNAIHSSVDCI